MGSLTAPLVEEKETAVDASADLIRLCEQAADVFAETSRLLGVVFDECDVVAVLRYYHTHATGTVESRLRVAREGAVADLGVMLGRLLESVGQALATLRVLRECVGDAYAETRVEGKESASDCIVEAITLGEDSVADLRALLRELVERVGSDVETDSAVERVFPEGEWDMGVHADLRVEKEGVADVETRLLLSVEALASIWTALARAVELTGSDGAAALRVLREWGIVDVLADLATLREGIADVEAQSLLTREGAADALMDSLYFHTHSTGQLWPLLRVFRPHEIVPPAYVPPLLGAVPLDEYDDPRTSLPRVSCDHENVELTERVDWAFGPWCRTDVEARLEVWNYQIVGGGDLAADLAAQKETSGAVWTVGKLLQEMTATDTLAMLRLFRPRLALLAQIGAVLSDVWFRARKNEYTDEPIIGCPVHAVELVERMDWTGMESGWGTDLLTDALLSPAAPWKQARADLFVELNWTIADVVQFDLRAELARQFYDPTLGVDLSYAIRVLKESHGQLLAKLGKWVDPETFERFRIEMLTRAATVDTLVREAVTEKLVREVEAGVLDRERLVETLTRLWNVKGG
jgi:hypothetical protein